MADKVPLQEWLKLDKKNSAELALYLDGLSREMESGTLGVGGPGRASEPVDALRIQTAKRYVAAYSQNLHDGQYGILSQNQQLAAEQAAEMAFGYEEGLRGYFQTPEEIAAAKATAAGEARGAVDAIVSRYLGSRKNLSDRVWDTTKLQTGYLNKLIDTALLKGVSWRDLAKAVRSSINPNVKGGVAYAAKRLARTEINNAFHVSALRRYEESDIVEFVQWHLSTSHPEGDECDDYADARVPEYPDEKGLWPLGEVPEKPHPNCFCYITPFLPSPEDFFNSLFEEEGQSSVDPFKKTPWGTFDDSMVHAITDFEDDTGTLRLYTAESNRPNAFWRGVGNDIMNEDREHAADFLRRQELLVDLFDRLPNSKQDMVVSRGVAPSMFKELFGAEPSEANFNKVFKGQTITSWTPVSTSGNMDLVRRWGDGYSTGGLPNETPFGLSFDNDGNATKNVQMRVFVPKGTSALDVTQVSEYGSEEGEILLPPGTKLTMVGAQTHNGYLWIDAIAEVDGDLSYEQIEKAREMYELYE